MAKTRADNKTIDILTEWVVPDVAICFSTDERIRAATLNQRISRSISEILKDSDKSRDEIAREMSNFLGEEISKNMLDAYASQARQEHTISLARAFALVYATGDARIFGSELGSVGFAVVNERYVDAVKDALIEDKREQLRKAQLAARRRWKGALK